MTCTATSGNGATMNFPAIPRSPRGGWTAAAAGTTPRGTAGLRAAPYTGRRTRIPPAACAWPEFPSAPRSSEAGFLAVRFLFHPETGPRRNHCVSPRQARRPQPEVLPVPLHFATTHGLVVAGWLLVDPGIFPRTAHSC